MYVYIYIYIYTHPMSPAPVRIASGSCIVRSNENCIVNKFKSFGTKNHTIASVSGLVVGQLFMTYLSSKFR